MRNLANKKFLCNPYLMLPVFLVLTTSMGWASDSFKLDLSYLHGEEFLKIVIQRLDDDEISNFMQKITIYKNNESVMEESMINQNHLKKITKMVPFSAQPDDQIKVYLHYADDQTVKSSFLVPWPSAVLRKEDQPSHRQDSILIKNKNLKDEEVSGDHNAADTTQRNTQANNSTNESSQRNEYEYSDFGSKSDKESYGYREKERSDYRKDLYGFDPYGYGVKKKTSGYADPKHIPAAQERYGYSNMGFEGEKESYGRDTYED